MTPLALWGAMFACMLAVYTAFNWVPTMLNGAGLGLRVASNGLAAFNLGGVVGAICGGLVIARIGSKPTMLTIAAAAVAGAVALALTPITATASALPIVALLGFTGAAINAIQTTLYALAAHVYPTAVRATGVGTAVAFGRVGGVLSSYAGEWAIGAGGSAAFFALMATAMAVVFVCLALVARHVPRPDQAAHGLASAVTDAHPRSSPHTSRAVSTMSDSFAISSSIVSALPSTVDEKPHCGLRHSCSSGTNFAASSIRRLRLSFCLEYALLRRHEPKHDELARRARSAAARTLLTSRRRTRGRTRRRSAD